MTLPNFAQIEPQMPDLLKSGRRGCFDFALKIPKKQTGKHFTDTFGAQCMIMSQSVFFFAFFVCVNVM